MLRRLIDRVRSSKYRILEATETDFGQIAAMHEESFPRGWSKAEIANLAGQKSCTLLVARKVGHPKAPIMGFNLIRQTEDEAEILSIASSPKRRRRGLGRELMREALRRLHADRVKALFLEVDDTNQSAIKLYQSLGFQTVGNRPGYYTQSGQASSGKPATALVMRLDLV